MSGLDGSVRKKAPPVLQRSGSALALSNKDDLTKEWRVCTIGSQVGKSAIVVRWVHDKFSDVDEPTVEDSYGKETTFEGEKIKVKVLDTSGSDSYASFRTNWYRSSTGFMLVFAITESESNLRILSEMFEEIVKVKGTDKFPCVLVGTRMDLAEKRLISTKKAKFTARKFNCPYVEVSALTGENIDLAFETLFAEMKYGKKKDPFVQEQPYYGSDKKPWKELFPLQLKGPAFGPDLVKPTPGFNIESGTSESSHIYVYPLNIENEPTTEVKSWQQVFGVTLEECMNMQKDKVPELKIPRILHYLIDLFYFFNGPETEGIFRLSAAADEVKDMKDSIDRGIYKVHQASSVHVVCALIKLWLRSLKEPLIPSSKYDEAVNNPDKALQVFRTLPQINQNVIQKIVDLVSDISKPEIAAVTKMTKENLALVIAPGMLRTTSTNPVELLEAAAKEMNVTLQFLTQIPVSRPRILAVLPKMMMQEREEKYIDYFKEFISEENEHTTFIGKDEKDKSTIVISVVMATGRDKFRTLIMTKENTTRLLMPAVKGEKEVLGGLKSVLPELNLSKLKPAKNQKKLIKELLTFEQNQSSNKYKFGVLLCKENQTEDEMYSNLEMSPELEIFMNFLGEKVTLKDFKNYNGGLDIKKNSTGTHSYYTRFEDSEIMFHVAPLLPYNEKDKQQLERKRHLGNDIIIIVFKESDQPFKPELMRSEFNNIFIVVHKMKTGSANKTFYKLSVVCKDAVPPFGPPIFSPSVYEKGPELRKFLLTKLINGERAALHGCPAFSAKMVSVRKTILESIEKSFMNK